jgi:phage-Barnase-EndoU-ColicinE5/D-RelE like nuclease2/Phage Mu protein F like protein
MAEIRDGWGQQFDEALQFFRQKLNLPTLTWRDILGRSHDRSFVVAGAMKDALLADLRAEIEKGIAGKVTLAEFRKTFDEIVKRHGWTGWTGEGSEAGRAWRTRVIYETNLKTAYAAGRYSQMTDPDVVKVQKWWRYRHAYYRVPERERIEHVGWSGMVLAWDDPWWDTHYPPNGWNCSCGVETLSDEDLREEGIEPETAPEIETRSVRDPRTGETLQVPKGVDFGWDHAPGRDWSRGLVPNELQNPLNPLRPGQARSGRVATPPLPEARAFAAPLLPKGLTEEDYVERFLAEFGASIGRPVMIRDAAGHALPISEDLFRTGNGRLKVTKRGREQHVLRLAEAIRDPDEIWASWHKPETGEPVLLRSYLRRGDDSQGFALFRWSSSGWTGLSAFQPDKAEYLDKERLGALIYRRK